MSDYLFLFNDTDKGETSRYYFEPFGITPDDWLFVKTEFRPDGKPLSKTQTDKVLDELFDRVPLLKDCKVIVTNNGNYFKSLTGATKVEAYIGTSMDCKATDAKVIFVPAIGSVLYSPNKYEKLLDIAMTTIKSHLNNKSTDTVKKVLKNYHRPVTYKGIKKALSKLSKIETPVTIDVEAYSLDHPTAGLGTIAFGLNQHTAIAIPVDHNDSYKNRKKTNRKVRALLKEFFIKAKDQKHIYHNISYDAKILIYSLFMESISDRKGMFEGIKYVMNNWEDTQIISYLCFNSTDRPDLSLKYQALEYAGNWATLVADDINDIRKLDSETLCYYNAIDCGATYFVYEKNLPILISENQYDVYENIFKPSQEELIKAQLTGICIDRDRVLEVQKELTTLTADIETKMNTFTEVIELNEELRETRLAKENSKRKLQKGLESIPDWIFNPGSDNHVRKLLYDRFQVPPERFTDTKQPATNAKALNTVLANPDVSDRAKEFIELLSEYNKIAIILSTFIPAFLKCYLSPEGDWYVFGNYKITGTVSTRLSSSKPNLQNIPARGKYGEMVKSCVIAPKGCIMIGLDADSLEDKISALTTKDPNKLAVYEKGMDGHCFNAYNYFKDEMPDIDPTCIDSINSIAEKYPELRQESKAYTFLLTYQGGVGAMVANFGIPRDKAERIYNAYHSSYDMASKAINDQLEIARDTGYVIGAFGVRIRTPLMKATRHSSASTRPYAVRKEEKTAGNALGQSYCKITDRNAIDMGRRIVRDGLQEDILLSMLIHDALYYYVKDDPVIIEYANRNLVDAFSWQNLPELQHPVVKLSGTMDIFYPNWTVSKSVSKTASVDEVTQILNSLKDNKNE